MTSPDTQNGNVAPGGENREDQKVEEKEFLSGANATLPESFPSGVPTPSGLVLQNVIAGDGDYDLVYGADDWRKEGDNYISSLQEAGFTKSTGILSELPVEASNLMYEKYEKGRETVAVMAGETRDNQGYLSISVKVR